MAVRDRPGSLLASLQPFAEREINLHKLESRPRRGKPFEYVFYVDLMAPVDAPEVEDALAQVAEHTRSSACWAATGRRESRSDGLPGSGSSLPIRWAAWRRTSFLPAIPSDASASPPGWSRR